MKFDCTVVYGLATEEVFRVCIKAETRFEAEKEALRICKAAFPGQSIVDYGAREVVENPTIPYSVRIEYDPPTTRHFKWYEMSHCSSQKEAERAARILFLNEHPGSTIHSVETRTPR